MCDLDPTDRKLDGDAPEDEFCDSVSRELPLVRGGTIDFWGPATDVVGIDY